MLRRIVALERRRSRPSRAGGGAPRLVTFATSSLANGATWQGDVDIAPGFIITRVQTDFAARVRLYQASPYRTADASRPVGVLPSGSGQGLIFEEDGSSAADYPTNVVGGLLSSTSTCPVSVTNRSGATRVITVVLEVVA